MNKQWLDGMWEHMRHKYGMYLRVLDAIPADQFDAHPVAGMRTPAELAAHTSGLVRAIAEGVASGTIEAVEQEEGSVAATLESKEAVLDFARDCWDRAEKAIAATGDENLTGEVGNPWGIPGLNGTFAMVVLNDELTHHRGQFYAYARACGVEPPFMWGFDENPDGFRPAAQ